MLCLTWQAGQSIQDVYMLESFYFNDRPSSDKLSTVHEL